MASRSLARPETGSSDVATVARPPTPDERLGALEERVGALAEALVALKTTLDTHLGALTSSLHLPPVAAVAGPATLLAPGPAPLSTESGTCKSRLSVLFVTHT